MDVDPFSRLDLTNRPSNALSIFDHRPLSRYASESNFVSKRYFFLRNDLLVFRKCEKGPRVYGRLCCGDIIFRMTQDDLFKKFLLHAKSNIQEFRMECHRVLGFMKEYAGEVISPALLRFSEGSVLDCPDEEVT